MVTSNDIIAILPVVVVVVWAALLLLADLWLKPTRATAILAAAGLAVGLGLTLAQIGRSQTAFNGMAVIDSFAVFLNVLLLLSGLAGIGIAYSYLHRIGVPRGEYYPLLMFTLSGMMLMSYANDLIVVFLALELLSIPLYILSGFSRARDAGSEEAALKYFLLGTFASAFVLFGVALIFGATARTDLPGITAAVASAPVNFGLLVAGAALLLVGLGFKVSAVPFHMWTPDVYHGAPSSVTGFMSVGAKVAGFTALARVFITALPAIQTDLTPIFWTLSVLTMVVGNVVAIAQSNIKRMLAYSSVAHAGYLLMALVPYGNAAVVKDSVAALLFYLAAYAFTGLGAWAVVVAVEQAEGKGLQINDYAGLGRKAPWLAACMTIFMLSFAGIPPTLGFFGKFYLFSAAVQGGFVGLAIIAVITSLISVFYYLRVIVVMYMRPGEPEVARDTWAVITAVISAAAVILIGIISAPLFQWAARSMVHMP